MGILGVDIGANNIKMILLKNIDKQLQVKQLQIRRYSSKNLMDDLSFATKYLLNGDNIKAAFFVNSVTLNYTNNNQGLMSLNKTINKIFIDIPTNHITAEGKIVSTKDKNDLLIYSFMGTNFYPSAYIASKVVKKGFMIDIGTSSTDIIAIKNGKPNIIAVNQPDYNRLSTGELMFLEVYILL